MSEITQTTVTEKPVEVNGAPYKEVTKTTKTIDAPDAAAASKTGAAATAASPGNNGAAEPQ